MYVTQSVTLVGPDSSIAFEVVVADSPSEAAFYTLRAQATIT